MKTELKKELLQTLLEKPAREETPLETIQRQSFQALLPVYILNGNLQYLDWNAAFDEIIARPYGFKRGMHGSRLIECLANCDEVMERSMKVFDPGKHPLVDTEPLLLKHARYGLVRFQKLAVQLLDDKGQRKAWALILNITSADNLEQLWKDITDRLAFEAGYHRYLVERDSLTVMKEANALIVKKIITSTVFKGTNCLELGSGQGQLTESLLRNQGPRIIAQEDNAGALELFRRRAFVNAANLAHVNEGVNKLDEYPDNYFDSVVSWDGLWRRNASLSIFNEISRILKPGGQFAVLQRIAENSEVSENDEAFSHAARELETIQPLWTSQDLGRAIDGSGLKIERFENHRFDREFVLVVARKV